jgi:hypothetical protein
MLITFTDEGLAVLTIIRILTETGKIPQTNGGIYLSYIQTASLETP